MRSLLDPLLFNAAAAAPPFISAAPSFCPAAAQIAVVSQQVLSMLSDGMHAVSLAVLLPEAFYPGNDIKSSEIFVSDGSKCDITRLQLMFGPEHTIALQDPSYPARTLRPGAHSKRPGPAAEKGDAISEPARPFSVISHAPIIS